MPSTKKKRLKEVETLIDSGIQVSRIAEMKAAQWDVSQRQVWNYISEIRDKQKEKQVSFEDTEILELFDEWKAAYDEDNDSKCFDVWRRLQPIIEEQPELQYERPEEAEKYDWGRFIKFGWAHPGRIERTLDEDGERLRTGLAPLDAYCEAVMLGYEPANRWVQLAVERHYKDLKRQATEDFPYYFEPKAAKHYLKFFSEKLEHYEGAFAGDPIEAEPWQWFVYGTVFGWLKVEKFRGFAIRRFRKATIIVPKKNGKSIWSGGTGLYMMDYDEWPGAQCYIIATSQTHAMELGYRAATNMVENNDDLDDRYDINKGTANMGIHYPGNNNAFYKPITSKPDSEDGKNVHFCGPDETKDLTDFGIYNLMEEGMVSAPNSLMMNTTTAGFDTDSLGYDQQDYGEQILEGITEDEATFAIIYGIDPEDKEDEEGNEREGWWRDLELYKKANPNFGVSVFEDTIKSKFAKAQRSLEKRTSLITKHLNEWTSSSSAFVAGEKWDKCGTKSIEPVFVGVEDAKDIKKALKPYEGCKAVGGLDLGAVSDFTAFVLVIEMDERLEVLCFFWIPKDTIKDRENSSQVQEWTRKGYIYATPGDWTDHDFVEEMIKEIASVVNIEEIAYDRYKMNQMVTHLMDEGIEMTPFGQGYVSMAPAVDHLENYILQQKVEHFGNPVLAWMNKNVAIKRNPAGDRKFDKDKSKDKIDGMVAFAMALYRDSIVESEEGSVYNERGVITV